MTREARSPRTSASLEKNENANGDGTDVTWPPPMHGGSAGPASVDMSAARSAAGGRDAPTNAAVLWAVIPTPHSCGG
ncbi:hypothetical protein MTO96_049693 [Rhipicephalus appendiculatus]